MLLSHLFFNLDLSYTNITDESVLKLISCHTLNIVETQVIDESVSKLCIKMLFVTNKN